MSYYDLLIRGAEVLDPGAGIAGRNDLAVRNGRVAAIESAIAPEKARTVIDASGQYLLPGLVDLHTHIYPEATFWGIDPGEVAWRTGVTTWADAGSAGAYNFRGLRQRSHSRPIRTCAFINISATGLTAPTGELRQLELCDPAMCEQIAGQAGRFVVGVKVRIDRHNVGPHGTEPLRRALAAGRALAKPLMVHIGDGPPALADVLQVLSEGDIVTHCTTSGNMGLLDRRDALKPCVRAALDRGVVFDVGHGYGAFSFSVAEAILKAGLPHVISTDIHQLSIRGPMFDLPTCMSKFLAMGMSLADVVLATTAAPAQALGLAHEIGSLQVGRRADLSLFQMATGEFALYDVDLSARVSDRLLQNTLTLVGGVPLPPTAPEPPPPWVERTAAESQVESDLMSALRQPRAALLGSANGFIPGLTRSAGRPGTGNGAEDEQLWPAIRKWPS
jgi:dihydroorotase